MGSFPGGRVILIPYESQRQGYLSLTDVAAAVVDEAAVRCMAWEEGSEPSEKAASDMALVLSPWAMNTEPEWKEESELETY